VRKKVRGEAKEKARPNYKKECLDLWSLCVRVEQRKCQFMGCNKDVGLTAHHIRSVTHGATMLDTDNGLCVCWGHHRLQKLKSEWFQDQVIDVIGNEKYERLKKKSFQIFKWNQKDLKMMVFVLKNKLKSLQYD